MPKLTFDDVPNQFGWGIWIIPPGYGGVRWTNWHVMDTTEDRRTPDFSGYDRVAAGGKPVVAFNAFGNPCEILAPVGGRLTLHRVTLAAAYQRGLRLTVIGIGDGAEVARTTVMLDHDARTLLDLRGIGGFARVERLRFEPAGGRDPDPRDRYLGEGQVAFEDAVLDAYPAR